MRCSSCHCAGVDTDLLIVEGVKLRRRRRRKHNMMDHICLLGPHPRAPLSLHPTLSPAAAAAAAAAPPPLLYSSWLIIQASRRGVSHPVPRPTHCQPSPSPCPEGQDRTGQDRTDPRARARGADKALSFSLSAPRCQPANPRGPNMGSTQILRPHHPTCPPPPPPHSPSSSFCSFSFC